MSPHRDGAQTQPVSGLATQANGTPPDVPTDRRGLASLDKNWDTEDRARTWQAIVRLAQQHDLNLDICAKWMLADSSADAGAGRREWQIIRARYLAKSRRTWRQLAAREQVTLQDLESIATRGLLRLLSRLCLYHLNVSKGWSGPPLV